MNNKKNKNGFTLVELVIVMCIFGAIFACILNFIKPANQVHNDTQATMDANVITSGLIEYMDDELRYATNVLVLENFLGVPEVSSSGVVGNTGVSYTNCLVIDNVNPRGFLLSSYDPNGKIFKTNNRLQATGCIYKVSKIDTEGLNFNNAVVAKGVPFYENLKYSIVASTNVLDANFDNTKNQSNLSVNISTYKPYYDKGKLTFQKKFDRGVKTDSDTGIVKDRAAVIDFTNINIGNDDPFDLQAATAPMTNPTQSIAVFAGQGYQTATAPASATDSQKLFYNAVRQVDVINTKGETVQTVPRYTYIFYQKNSAASASQCEVKMVYSADHPIASLQGQQIGETKKQEKGTIFKNFENPPKISGYLDPYWIGPDGKTVDTTKGYRIEKNTVFTCVYAPEETKPHYTVTWQNVDGSVYDTSEVFEGNTPDEMGRPNYSATATTEQNKDYWDKHTLVGWFLKGTNTPATSVTITSNGIVFVPKVENKLLVKFPAVSYEYYIDKGETATLPSDTPAAPEGKVFDYWAFDGTDDKFDSKPITADTTFVPKFKDKPAGLGGWSISYTIEDQGTGSVWYNNADTVCSKYKVNLKFETENAGEKLVGFKVNIKLNKACHIVNCYNCTITGNGTKTIGIQPTIYDTYHGVQNGSTHNLNNDPLHFDDPTVKIESIELVMISK